MTHLKNGHFWLEKTLDLHVAEKQTLKTKRPGDPRSNIHIVLFLVFIKKTTWCFKVKLTKQGEHEININQ